MLLGGLVFDRFNSRRGRFCRKPMKFDALMNYLSLTPLLPKSWLQGSWLQRSLQGPIFQGSSLQQARRKEPLQPPVESPELQSQVTKFGFGLLKDEHRPSFMRRFIRHPSGIPIHYQVNESSKRRVRPLKNIGVGGLCFVADRPLTPGLKIHIRIPLEFRPNEDAGFDAEGYVAWCTAERDQYAIGVEFNEGASQFCVRMVEQVCHIEEYRANAKLYQGRELSSEEAAKEWVEQFASTFPN